MKTTNGRNRNAETSLSDREEIELDSELERFCDFMGFDSERRRNLLQSIARIKLGPPSDPWVAAKFVEIIDTEYFQCGGGDIVMFCGESLGWKADALERNAEICMSVVEAAKKRARERKAKRLRRNPQ